METWARILFYDTKYLTIYPNAFLVWQILRNELLPWNQMFVITSRYLLSISLWWYGRQDSKHNAITWWCLEWRWGLSAQMGHTWKMNPNLTSLLNESIFLLCIVAIAQLKPLMLHLKIVSIVLTNMGKRPASFRRLET